MDAYLAILEDLVIEYSSYFGSWQQTVLIIVILCMEEYFWNALAHL